MTANEHLIDEIDLALFRLLRRAHDLKPTDPKSRELITAIRHARSLSEAMLPDSRRREFERQPDPKLTDFQIVQPQPPESIPASFIDIPNDYS